jgi:hypothetical protein
MQVQKRRYSRDIKIELMSLLSQDWSNSVRGYEREREIRKEKEGDEQDGVKTGRRIWERGLPVRGWSEFIGIWVLGEAHCWWGEQ